MSNSCAKLAVAVVEDDPETRKMLCGWIENEPRLRLAGQWADIETALKSAPASKPDVVLMDINLPGMSGIVGTRRLKQLLPETQIIIVTVYDDAEHIFEALAAGATGYLLKRGSREELLHAVEDVHRGGSPMNSKIARKVVQSFSQHPLPVAPEEALSAREREVLDLLARGYLYKEIADLLGVTLTTVNTYVRRAYEKLHVRSRARAIALYARLDPARGPASESRG